MKLTICRRVCREIEETESARILSALSMEHVRLCSRCQDFLNQRLRLIELLGTLVPVEAPGDFDRRLRARLAATNEQRHVPFKFNLLSFSLRPLAVTMVLLVMLAALVWRVYRPTKSPANLEAVSESPSLRGVDRSDTAKPVQTGNEQVGVIDDHIDRRGPTEKQGGKLAKPQRIDVASLKNAGRTVSKDFSSVPAPVLRSEEPIANTTPVFPIETSYQALRLSLDDSNGVPRTISVPAVSFGSQRVLTGSGSTAAQNSAKGDW